MMKQKVLLTGAQGQLGRTLQTLCPPYWQLTALGSAQLDITDAGAVRRQVGELQPSLIINAAAYNAVDRAEQERQRAFAVNAYGPLNLAQAANDVGARLMHVSTDYVFDGRVRQPYDEQARPNPVNVYGESKLQGEQWVLQTQPQALVLRTAWVYSALGESFVAAMLRAASQGQPLKVVNDQTGAPTYAGDLAQAIIDMLAYPNASTPAKPVAVTEAAGGLYHYSGATALTRYDFARAIFEAADRVDGVNRLGRLTPIPSSDYPAAATRPEYSVLDCSKIAALGIKPRPLAESLPGVVRDLLAQLQRPVHGNTD